MSELELILNFYKIPFEGKKIVCPFHGDINASLLINLEDDRWFCFGCQRGGDAKDFIKEMEQCNDFEAYKILAKIKNNNHVPIILNKKIINKENKSNIDDYNTSKDYYFNLNKINWKAAKKYDAEKEKKYLIDRGFTIKVLNESGCKITYNRNYPIVFPMYDMNEFKGYVCRTMDKEIEQNRKYLYNKGFSRRNTLVGKYNNSTIMIVEGFMDYLKAKQFNIKYVCALLGWKVTKEQIAKMKKAGVKTIISALDNDKCGKEGTKFISQYFDVIPFAYPKSIKDIGEMTEEQFKHCKKKTIERRNKSGI